MKPTLIFLLSILSFSISAQVQFVFDQGIPVVENGVTLTRAFEGGLNSAQFQTMDLNGDDKEDLVVFHRISRSINTYLNVNDEWVLSPYYQTLFPEDVVNWMILKDFDCDGQKDLFTSTALGIKVYRNQNNSGLLSWEVASEFLTWDGGSNIQVAPTDIPGIADVNGDGAIDILTYRFGSSGSVDYYQNNGNCGNLTFTRITRQWGNFFDCGCNDFSFGQPCASAGGEVRQDEIPMEQQVILHAGGKTILPFDADNDGDIDIITSDELCKNLTFLRNDGTSDDAQMTSFSPYPSGNPVDYEFFPVAFMEDIDFDGVSDLIVSTNLDNNVGNQVDFTSQIGAYSNTGSNEIPNFVSRTPFLQHEMIDVGEDAFPTFHDFDADGDLDMFISNTSTPINQTFIGTVWFYENTGGRFDPAFELRTKNFAQLADLDYTHLKPLFEDLDNDGITDLILQAKIGPLDTRVFFMKGDENFEFDSPVDLGFDVTDASNPHLFDINQDGLSDMLIGNQFGSMSVYLNEGNLNFSEEITEFGGLEDDFNRQNLSIAVGKFQSDSPSQIIAIDSQGKIILYTDEADENFRANESSTNLIGLEDELGSIDFGRANYMATVDLHSDGFSSLVIGSSKGGLYFLRNRPSDGGSENELRVAVAPNPTSTQLRVIANEDGMADIIDLTGKVIEKDITIERSVAKELNFSSVPAGIYLLRIRTQDGRSKTQRILIQP
ncbi:T9SS type A sorting domain-containing protein [Roseivirga sp.]|uniref:T9SS type A sorting domain-containing protein n=1 Tax=Roseivirga sp. TaxID=1964215 RepID=UPI003B52E5CB